MRTMKLATSLLSLLILALIACAPASLLAEDSTDLFGEDLIRTHKGDVLDDADYRRILVQEQIDFYDQDLHKSPIRRRTRTYSDPVEIFDSYFDIHWDTVSFRSQTTQGEGAALITLMFKDTVRFEEEARRRPFSVSTFMNKARKGCGSTGPRDVVLDWIKEQQDRRYPWDERLPNGDDPLSGPFGTSSGWLDDDLLRITPDDVYVVGGYKGLFDFSQRNRDLVKNVLTRTASRSHYEKLYDLRADLESDASVYRRIKTWIKLRKLPALVLVPGDETAVLVHKVVERSDGLATLFYWDPANPPAETVDPEGSLRHVFFAHRVDGRLRFSKTARLSNRRYRFGDSIKLVMVDDLCKVYEYLSDYVGRGDLGDPDPLPPRDGRDEPPYDDGGGYRKPPRDDDGDHRRPPYDDDYGKPPFDDDYRQKPLPPDYDKPPFDDDYGKPPFDSGRRLPPYDQGRRLPPYDQGRRFPPYDQGRFDPPIYRDPPLRDRIYRPRRPRRNDDFPHQLGTILDFVFRGFTDANRGDRYRPRPRPVPLPPYRPLPPITYDGPYPPPDYRPPPRNRFIYRGPPRHRWYNKPIGEGRGKFRFVGYMYDEFGYNVHGYDQDGYDINGFDPWGFDRQGYDSKGFNPWGYDRGGKTSKGFPLSNRSPFFIDLVNQYHRDPLMFRMQFDIKQDGKIVRIVDGQQVWPIVKGSPLPQPAPAKPGTGDGGADKGKTEQEAQFRDVTIKGKITGVTQPYKIQRDKQGRYYLFKDEKRHAIPRNISVERDFQVQYNASAKTFVFIQHTPAPK